MKRLRNWSSRGYDSLLFLHFFIVNNNNKSTEDLQIDELKLNEKNKGDCELRLHSSSLQPLVYKSRIKRHMQSVCSHNGTRVVEFENNEHVRSAMLLTKMLDLECSSFFFLLIIYSILMDFLISAD